MKSHSRSLNPSPDGILGFFSLSLRVVVAYRETKKFEYNIWRWLIGKLSWKIYFTIIKSKTPINEVKSTSKSDQKHSKSASFEVLLGVLFGLFKNKNSFKLLKKLKCLRKKFQKNSKLIPNLFLKYSSFPFNAPLLSRCHGQVRPRIIHF